MHDDGIIDVFLQPGEYFVGDASFRIRTLLGSCVSITLWHRRLRVGAMSHFLLPGTCAGMVDARYSEDAMALMLTGLRQYGVHGHQCEAKLFGGGDMFPGRRAGGAAIGKKNGAAALDMLADHGIPVVSECLFGIGHRQVIFDVANGDVWSRHIEKSAT